MHNKLKNLWSLADFFRANFRIEKMMTQIIIFITEFIKYFMVYLCIYVFGNIYINNIMKWMQLIILRMLIQMVECGWELFKSELIDSSTFSLWKNSNNQPCQNLVQVCDLQPLLNSKLLQGDSLLSRNILMTTSRTFSKIRISFDIYYINFWSVAESLAVYANNLLVHYEKPQISQLQDYPLRFCVQRPFGKSYAEKFSRIDQEISFNDPNLNIEIIHEGVSTGTTSEYGISNFVLQVFFCEDKCEECDEHLCLICKKGFQLINNQCVCHPYKQYLYYNPDLTCVDECPLNYVSDDQRICQQSLVSTVYSDLDEDTFSSYKFKFVADKYYSVNKQMINMVGSKSIAGMFSNTDSVIFDDVNLQPNFKYIIQFKLYITNKISKLLPETILILFNQYVVVYIEDFNQIYLNSPITKSTTVGLPQKCSIIQFSSCVSYEITIQVELTELVTELMFKTKFQLNTYQRTWGFRDLKISQYEINSSFFQCENNCQTCHQSQLSVCLSCSGSLKLFNGNCISQCPSYTTVKENVCYDPAITSFNDKYLLNMYHDMNYYPQNNMTFPQQQLGTSYFMNRIILGGIGIWQNEQIHYEFSHEKLFYKVKVQFMLLFIDSTNGQILFRTSINNELSQYNMFGSSTSVDNQVGQPYVEMVQSVSYVKSFESTNKLKVQLQCLQGIDTQAYCGVYDLRIIVSICQDKCLKCDENGNCINQIDTISTNINGCKDGYYRLENQCIQCTQGCTLCTDMNVCQACESGYEFKFNSCFCSKVKERIDYCEQKNCFHNCQTCTNTIQNYGIFRQQHPKNCLSCDESKNLWLNVNQCSCLDGYYMEDFSCYLCQPTCLKCYQQARTCTACHLGQNRILERESCRCLDGYFQEDNDLVCSKCNDLCQNCNFTKDQCNSCYSSQNRKLHMDSCICKDGYYDVGDLNCKKCPSHCQTCLNEKTCITCNEDQYRILSIDNETCICQSGYFNLNFQDTCGKCHTSCLECKLNSKQEQCTRCPSTRVPKFKDNGGDTIQFECKCRRGYYESYNQECSNCADYLNPPTNHYCYSNCGDSIVQWNEDCDDGNNIDRDTCYKCLHGNSFCFDYTCTECLAGQCIGCIDGFYLTQEYICQPCNSSCKTCVDRANNCTDCIIYKQDNSGCLMCEQDQGFHIIDSQCISICGDGIQVEQEECDDGNIVNGDGCDQFCKIEQGFKCGSNCEEMLYPQIVFEVNESNNNFDKERLIRIKTDSVISITGSINSIINFKVNNCDEYDLTYVDLTQYSDKFTQLFLELTLIFKESVQDPELVCQIINQNAIFNQDGNSFIEKNYMIQLKEYNQPSVLNQQVTDGLMKLSRYVLYLLFGFAIIAFLFGGLNIFWNLLDVLQLISYLKFFNVYYPYNLNNYLTIFGFAQFDFLKDYIDLETLISQYVNTPDAEPKFRDDGYSTVFYVNIITVLTVFMTTIVTYIACTVLLSTLTKFSHSFIYVPLNSQEQSICTFFVYRVIRNLYIQLMRFKKAFTSGVIRTFMAVAFDYNLALFLQLKDFDLSDPILFTSFLCCLVAFAIELIFISIAINFMSKPTFVFKQKFNVNYFGAIYEGIKLKQNPFTYYFNIILLVKKMLFMMFLVMFYSSPCLQIGLVSLLNIVMALYLIKNQPLKDKDEYQKQVGSEILIWFAEMLILAFAINEQTNSLTEDSQLIIGWCVITLTSTLILLQLFIDVKQHVNFLINEYSIIKKLIQKLKQIIYKKPPLEEQNIFLKQRRRMGIENLTTQSNIMTNQLKTLSNYKYGRMVTFTVSSSSS
ncbi:unnamed protein product [Paramecium sonneborni]|uniref:Uncharacterized protein n=1 Tax=Paramecium sonneborni TaxID=65129 RepID=A0A8S1LGE7_9CILI|nr:unnamed protein product [Paramecium sonneborni]